MKRLLLAYLAGAASACWLAYHQGPETIIQAGLKLAAAQATYDFTAAPRGTVQAATYDVPVKARRK